MIVSINRFFCTAFFDVLSVDLTFGLLVNQKFMSDSKEIWILAGVAERYSLMIKVLNFVEQI